METALKAIEVSEDVLAATAAQPPMATLCNGEWIGKQCVFLEVHDSMLECGGEH